MPIEYQPPKRFPLDVAGQIFPAARTRSWSCIVHISFLLKEEIDLLRLRQALEDIHQRFPSFFVSLRSGLFSYSLARVDNLNIIEPAPRCPCRSIDIFSKNTPVLRVYYGGRRVSVEMPHFVADGGAALIFAKTLLIRYLQLGGVEIPQDSSLPDFTQPPCPEEWEDSYIKNYTRHTPKPEHQPFAYQYRPPVSKNHLQVMHGEIPLEEILPLAKKRGLTLTEYLACVYLYAFYHGDRKARSSRRPIRISVPISLRSIYASKSLRNFSAYCRVGIYPRDKDCYTFEDIIACVRGKLAQAQKKENVHKFLCQNTGMTINPFLRAIPNFIRRPVMFAGFYLTGEFTQTAPLSNLGRINLPEAAADHVESTACLVNASPAMKLNCTLLSDARLLHIYFSSDSEATDVQRAFFRFLEDDGACARLVAF